MGIVVRDNRVKVRWLASRSLPVGGSYRLYGANYGGPVDFGTSLAQRAMDGWPTTLRKGGFGHGAFGHAGFGYGDVGVGFGHFPFGHGRFGYGTVLLASTLAGMPDGLWELAVVSLDPAGNATREAPPVETVELVVAGAPGPPGLPRAEAYDDEGDTLTLTLELSEDDEG